MFSNLNMYKTCLMLKKQQHSNMYKNVINVFLSLQQSLFSIVNGFAKCYNKKAKIMHHNVFGKF
jgi:hypothetical protein